MRQEATVRRLLARIARHEAFIFMTLMVLVFIAVAWFVTFKMSVESTKNTWQTDMSIHSVPLEDIIVGGMGRDGIMPIDNPRFVSAHEVDWLTPDSPVIALEMHNEAHAYPLAVLIKHEIVNDSIGGTAIAVTFCPLCHSPVVYKRRVDGVLLRFGVSGNLYNSGFIMWDDHTESWWAQFTGRAIVGTYTGTELEIVPSQVVGWRVFMQRYPQGRVLVGDATRPEIQYGRNPYIGYDTNPSPFMYLGEVDPRLFATTRVLTGVVNQQPIAYPYDRLSAERVINDDVEGYAVVACWQPGAVSALDNATIAYSRDVGMAALFSREVDGRVLTFRQGDGYFVDNETGSTWNIFGEAVAGSLIGTRLQSLYGNTHFWFAWSSAHPETQIYNAN